MRIVFIGAVEFSKRALSQLIVMQAGVVGVCTLQESRFNTDHNDLSVLCEENRIPCAYAPDINSDQIIEWITDKCPDVIFCFGWSRLLQKKLLSLAPLGVIGFHPTALPANRGRHPLIWALVLGLEETGSTFFFMGEGADDGDILSQEVVTIDQHDNASSLYEKITQCALTQMRTFVPQLAAGSFTRYAQDARYATTWRKRGKPDGQIDWRMSSRSIHNLVRGLGKPYVGAHFLYRGHEIKVWDSECVPDDSRNIEPGKILDVAARGVVVRCGEQAIRLLNTEPEIKPIPGEYL